MENKNILRRTFSFLVDKVLILLFFIIIVVSISPYWAPGALGTYSAILEMSPSHYYSQDLYSNDLYFTVYFIINHIFFLLRHHIVKIAFNLEHFSMPLSFLYRIHHNLYMHYRYYLIR